MNEVTFGWTFQKVEAFFLIYQIVKIQFYSEWIIDHFHDKKLVLHLDHGVVIGCGQ